MRTNLIKHGRKKLSSTRSEGAPKRGLIPTRYHAWTNSIYSYSSSKKHSRCSVFRYIHTLKPSSSRSCARRDPIYQSHCIASEGIKCFYATIWSWLKICQTDFVITVRCRIRGFALRVYIFGRRHKREKMRDNCQISPLSSASKCTPYTSYTQQYTQTGRPSTSHVFSS